MATARAFCKVPLEIQRQGYFPMNGVGLILHIDDEQSIRASMAMLLGTDGYSVRSASSGAEALQFTREGLNPDVIITDFNLGQQITGAEIAEEIRNVLSYAPPIIMLTGDASYARFPRIADMIFWLTHKPVNAQLLLVTLQNLVQLSRATRNVL
jgi:CheY-like chemotaxis protein